MNSKGFLVRNSNLTAGIFRLWLRRCYSTEIVSGDEKFDITSADETPKYAEILTDEEKEEIMKKRLKSRLNQSHRNILNGRRPYEENMAWFHNTIRYKKRMLGRHGMEAMDVPIGAVWPTKEEIEDKILFEKTAYPKSIQERWKEIEERNIQKEEEIRIREEELSKKLKMVGQWEKALQAKLAKKEADLLAAKERKARLVEEVRRQFGFAIDPRDERFKQLLEKKEKEDKKRKKEAKKQERAAKFIAHMMEKAKSETSETSTLTEEKKESEKQPEKVIEKET